MQSLNNIVDELLRRHPDGEILIESGGSPSGTYHLGHMRELITCDAIMLELIRRGRQARHIYFVDDLDAFRKVPSNVPSEFEQYLGMPLCDVPSPTGTTGESYADYFLQGLIDSCQALSVDVEFVRSHPKYRSGWFVPSIELCLRHVADIRRALETISNRKLDEHWTPIQVLENGRLKNRKFVSINTDTKTLLYQDVNGQEQQVGYDKGEVKLDWRLDWPARWWQLQVQAEPFGREHASAGGSYDTGVQIMKDVFKADPPLPVAYDSINMVGDTKKMSASKGTAIGATQGTEIMPAEVIRYFILRVPFNKLLYFDPVNGVVQLMDEFAALNAKSDKTADDEQLLYLCTRGLDHKTVSRVPFSHLVASYQSALKNDARTLDIIARSEHAATVASEKDIIIYELRFIDEWLRQWAPDDVKFALLDSVEAVNFNTPQQAYMRELADMIATAPADADGAWFHQAIYGFKDTAGLEPKQLFTTLYQVTIGKDSGPRAGWFLSILPRDWLVKRLRLEH